MSEETEPLTVLVELSLRYLYYLGDLEELEEGVWKTSAKFMPQCPHTAAARARAMLMLFSDVPFTLHDACDLAGDLGIDVKEQDLLAVIMQHRKQGLIRLVAANVMGGRRSIYTYQLVIQEKEAA